MELCRARSTQLLRRNYTSVLLVVLLLGGMVEGSHGFDYRDALERALVFYEGQRSGALPADQRLMWRGDSALTDGIDSSVDLSGGYYDAGDNVKYQFPMAFTISLLSWSVLEYAKELESADQLQFALHNIVWGTNYFLKAIAGPNQIFVQFIQCHKFMADPSRSSNHAAVSDEAGNSQFSSTSDGLTPLLFTERVGDPNSDHNCWERPEDMDTPRVTLQINATSPGTEVAAETAAALAAASLALRESQSSIATYADMLLDTANTVFTFANTYRGTFNGACPFYCSASGYNDELLWAAAWLYRASKDPIYLHFLLDNGASCGEVNEFSWDNKNAGVQVFLSKLYMEGETSLRTYSSLASAFVCHVLPGNSLTTVSYTPGGLLYIRDGANMQYVTGSTFLIAVFADYLTNASRTLTCGATVYTPQDLLDYIKTQVDYILGDNPASMSYMAGFGASYPTQVHHRGASIVSIHDDPTHIGCGEGFYSYFDRSDANPNILTGAIVGGPNSNDEFHDSRRESDYTEPTTYINSGFVGLLARLLR